MPEDLEYKSPDELFEELEEETQKTSEQELLEQGLKIIERTIIDYRERGFSVYLYTIEDTEPLIASVRLDKINEIKENLENWIPVRAKFAVRSRIIGIDGMKEEIVESRIRAIVSIEQIKDFKLPWQKVVVSRRNRIFVRKENTVLFFEDTENAIALEDYMRAKGLDTITVIMVTGGNIRINDADDIKQIRGIYWLTKEMWQNLKHRLALESKEEVKEEKKEEESAEEMKEEAKEEPTEEKKKEIKISL
ncbi:MAG: hypothetical protein ACTSVA_03315 [Candidatus Njordarchaeales archaeon]